MVLVRIFLMIYPLLVFGGFWDWFQPPMNNEKTEYYCPYHCGEWGSDSIRLLEWEFIQCLYNAQEMANYIEENYIQRGKEYPFRVKFSKEFIPHEISFRFARPENFDSRWYKRLRDSNEFITVSLSACIPRHYGCEGCRTALWKVTHFDDEYGNHIGKEFNRSLESEDYDYNFQKDEDDDDHIPYFEQLCEKINYKFGNFIDFHNACIQLESDLLLERNDSGCREYHYSPFLVEQIELKFAKVCQSLADAREKYNDIFVACAAIHSSPSASYNLALSTLSKGEYEESVEHFKSLFEKVDFDNLQMNLASKIHQSRGYVETEIASYDEAILSLSKAIELNPNNHEAYFERAISYFEQGEYDLSLLDFYKIEKNGIHPIFKEDPYLLDYAIGIITGASRGIATVSSEFLPSICNSFRGIGNLLWTTINDPIESSKLFSSAVIEFHQFLLSCDKAELAEILVPEIYELTTQWNLLSPQKRGELAGYALGKYGTDILLPIAVIKGIKYVKAYNELKKVEKFCTLKTLNNSRESKIALQQAATKWNAERLAWFKRAEIEIDKQTKHIPGKWNYEEGKSIWLLSETETQKLLKDTAGRGQKIFGEAGSVGYRERIDCGEIIGYFINHKTNEKVPTTMATIHYSQKGAHFVPAKPKKK